MIFPFRTTRISRHRPAALLTLLCLSMSNVFAIDLLESYQAALANDANYLAARSAREAGLEAVPQARAQLMPSVVANYSRSKLSTTSPSYVTLPSNKLAYFSENEGITLRQPLLRKSLVAGYFLAQSEAEGAEATFEKEYQSVAVRVAAAYFEALLADQQLALILAQKQSTQAILDSASAAFAKGVGTRTDIDESQAKYDKVLSDELAARQHIDYTRHELETLINQKVSHLRHLPESGFTFVTLEEPDLIYWQEQASQHNPEIRVMKAQLDGAEQQIEKGRAGHYPTVDLVIQRSLSGGESVTNPLNSYNTSAAGIQINVPLFAGGYYVSATRQAQAGKQKVTQLLEAARRSVSLQVRKAFQDVTEGVLRIQALEQSVRSSEQSLISSQQSFKAGVRSRLDVLGAEQRMVNAKRDLAEARFIYLLAHIKLYSLVGRADQEKIARINRVLAAN
jgi:outer membrane protein/protease secretion system outer membrane protein